MSLRRRMMAGGKEIPLAAIQVTKRDVGNFYFDTPIPAGATIDAHIIYTPQNIQGVYLDRVLYFRKSASNEVFGLYSTNAAGTTMRFAIYPNLYAQLLDFTLPLNRKITIDTRLEGTRTTLVVDGNNLGGKTGTKIEFLSSIPFNQVGIYEREWCNVNGQPFFDFVPMYKNGKAYFKDLVSGRKVKSPYFEPIFLPE